MDHYGRIALIVNSQSRKGGCLFSDARKALRRLGYEVDAWPITDPARISEIVEQALAREPDVLVVGGGDGTISSIVDHLVGQNIPLAILPLGTANSFARALGVPLDLDCALNLIGAGHRRRVDLGRIDADCFANGAAIGLAPRIAATIPHQLKRWGGRFGYALWAHVQFACFRPFSVRVDGKQMMAVEVRIANGGYLGGTEVAVSAEVDSGEIVVQVVRGDYRLALVASWFRTLVGLPQTRRLVELRGKRIAISARPAQRISVDGEVIAKTPVVASVLPRAIELFVPPRWMDAPVRELSRAG